MSLQTLEQLKERTSDLSAEEKLWLASYLVEQARSSLASAASPRKQWHSWQQLRGLYPTPMLGEDAQAWVSRTRQEGDIRRES